MPPESQFTQTSLRTDERLAPLRWIAAAAIAAVAAAILIGLARGAQGYPAAAVSVAADDASPGRTMAHWLAPIPEGVGVLEWRIPDAQIDAFEGAPVAIALSGPFSADVSVNGEHIGFKGRPGGDRASEVAGPIDAKLRIPAHVLLESNNRAIIRYSAQHLNYDPPYLVQGLRVVHFDADARRPLRYYTATLLALGAVSGLALALWRFSHRRQDRHSVVLAVGCFALLVSAGAEISRSFFSYPYPWHAPRQALAGAGIVGFCICLGAFSFLRWPISKRAFIAAAAAVALSLVGAAYFVRGFDGRTSVAAAAISMSTVIWLVAAGAKADRTALAFATLPFVLAVAAFITPGRFIDHQALTLSIAMLSYFLLAWPDLLAPPPAKKENTVPVRFAIKDGGNVAYVPIDDILRLKAAGNYTEVHLRDGGHRFDQRGIGALLEELPETFLRIHKSHAVHINAVRMLKGQEGSRYSVRLFNGEELPVGRSRINRLRAALS